MPLVHIQDAGAPCGNAWCDASGTSVSAPIIAGVIGLAGSQGAAEPQMLYAHAHSDPGAFRDVRSGATLNCSGQPICAARRGYDGPTGLGTPYGLAAFLANGGAIDRRHANVARERRVTEPAQRQPRTGRRKLTLRNGNAFAVRGTIALVRRVRVGGKLRRSPFASRQFTLGPLASTSMSLTISESARGAADALRRKRHGDRWSARSAGPAARPRTLSRTLPLYAP